MAPKPAVLTTNFTNAFLKASDLDERALSINYPIFEYDIEKGDKPWRKAGSDISDYFNYGFNEETWKIYCEKQRRLRIDGASVLKIGSDVCGQQGGDVFSFPPAPPSETLPTFQPTAQNFQLPPGMNFNLPPELANSIASLAASSLGLSSEFISQLPSIQSFLPQNMDPQMLFSEMVEPPQPSLEPETPIPEVKTPIHEHSPKIRESPKRRDLPVQKSSHRDSSRLKSRRDDDRYYNRRYREKRSHSRGHSRRERRVR